MVLCVSVCVGVGVGVCVAWCAQIEEIVDEMFRIEVPHDTIIIKQGDTGDYFYVVESGLFEIFVQRGEAPAVNVRVERT